MKGDPRSGRGPRKGAANAGRPPDQIRLACRLAFDQRIDTLSKFADDAKLDAVTRMKAIETLAKYGLGTTITPTDTDGKTLNGGVLAVPIGPGSAQWGPMAVAQQAALATRPSLAPSAES